MATAMGSGGASPGDGGGNAAFARVNLLPERTRLRLTERRRAAAWMFANAVAAVAGLLAWQWSISATARVGDERARLAEQLTRVRREERIGAGLSARLGLLERRLATLDTLRPTECWAARLARIAAAVPPDALLTQLTIPPPPAPAAPPPAGATAAPSPRPIEAAPITLAGFAGDHRRLADLLRRLAEDAGLDGVRLRHSAARGDGARRLIEFEIAATR